MLRSLIVSVTVAACLAPAALATNPGASRARLEVGPLIAGQDIVLDLRTTEPNAPTLLLLGFDGTPTVPAGPFGPVVGLNLTTALLQFVPTDAEGRIYLAGPTGPGAFGPPGSGVPLFFQYLIQDAGGHRFTSNVEAVEVEPVIGVYTDFLVEVGPAQLPANFDQVETGNTAIGDFNRDGATDIAFGAFDHVANDERLIIWAGDGAGNFSDVSGALLAGFPQGRSVGAVEAADLNRDGYVDLVVGGGYDDLTSVDDTLWKNGPGGFTQDANFPTGNGLAASFEFADLNNDGLIDVIVSEGSEQHLPSPTDGRDRIYYQEAGGFWNEDVAFSLAAYNDSSFDTNAIRAGDVDNNGFLDLLICRADTVGLDGFLGQPNVLLLNSGTALLDVSASNLLGNPSDNTFDAAFADLDLDGWLDIVVANSHASVDAAMSGDLYFNRGAGAPGVFDEDMTSELEISTPANWIRLTAEAADLDADGDTDVLLGIHDLFLGADQMLLLNQGGKQGGALGDLSLQSWYDPGDFISYGVSAFDMDQDGDLDLLQTAAGVVSGDPGQQYTARLYENTTL